MKNLLLVTFAFAFFVTSPAWAQTGTPGVTIRPTALTLAEGDSPTYTVVLETMPTGNVTVRPTHDSSAVSVSGALTFTTTTWNADQTVTVHGVHDPDYDNETATITHTVSGYPEAPAPPDVIAVVMDDQGAPFFTTTVPNQVYIVGMPVALTLPEGMRGEGNRQYHLNLPADIPPGLAFGASARTLTGTPTTVASAVTLRYSVSDSDTIADNDAGAQSFTITIVPDVTISESTISMQEHQTSTYTIVLDAAPPVNVTVRPTVPDGSAVTVSDPLTFTPMNWNTAQSVTVTGVEDPSSRDATVTITHTLSTADAVTTIGEVIVTVTNSRSTPGITINPTALTLAEGDSPTYTIVLNTMPTGNVMVTPTRDGSAVSVSGPVTFTTTNWNTAQSVTVEALRDGDYNNDTVVITHTVSGYPEATDFPDMTVTVDDEQGDPFFTTTVADQTYIVGMPVALTLPEAMRGEVLEGSSLRYHLNLAADIPPGLSFDRHARTLTGTPTTAAPAVTLMYGATDDDEDDVNLPFTITIVAAGPASPGVTIDPTAFTMDEVYVSGTNSPTYTVVLDTMPTGNVTVRPTAPGGSAVSVSGALTFTTTNWNTQQTVTLEGVRDRDDNDATVTITHTVSGYPEAPAPPDVIVTVTDNQSAPFFTTTVADQTYIVGMPVALTLPEATGGEMGRQYHLLLNANIPPGLSFDDDARTLTGTPTTEASAVTLRYEVEDGDAISGAVDRSVLPFTITIVAAAGGVTISTPALTVDEGSMGTYTAVLNTRPPGDVTVEPTADPASLANVSGALTFTTANWNTEQTVTVTALADTNAVTDTVTITHAVSGYGSVTNADNVIVTIPDSMAVTSPVVITPTTLTVEEGNMAVYTVVLSIEPTSVSEDPEGGGGIPTVTVTPTASAPVTVSGGLVFLGLGGLSGLWNVPQTITVTAAAAIDDAGATVTITHMVEGYDGNVAAPDVTVILPQPPRAPSFGSLTVDDQTYQAGTAISPLVLPQATSGNDGLTYTLTGAIPDGLTFTAGTRTLDGTPAMETPTVTLTYTVTDSDDNTAADDTATLNFDVTVGRAPAVVIDPTAFTVEEGSTTVYTVVLATNPGGDVTVTPTVSDTDKLTLTGTSTLSFSVADWSTEQTITVSATVDYDADDETVTITHAVVGYGTVTADSVTVMVDDVNNAPGFTMPVADQTYPAGVAITPLVLPQATGGNEDLTYTLTGSVPAGLAFDDDARTLSGTPVTMAPAVTLTYTVRDGDDDMNADDTASLIFTVEIGTMARVIIDPSALTVEEGSTTFAPYTVVLSTMPAGAVTVTPAVSGTGLAPLSALTFAAAAWNTPQTVTVSAPADPAATAARSIVINHSVTGYDGVSSAPDVTVTITLRHRVPSFGSLAVPDQRYTLNAAITPLTLPAAAGGNGSLSYALTGSIPAGLTWTEADRTLTGTPVTVDTTGVTLTYTVTDADDNMAADDTGVLTFTVVIDRVPAVTIDPTAFAVEEGSTTVFYTVVLTTDPGGDVTVTPTVSDGTKLTITGTPALTFSAADWSTVQTITVSATVDYDADNETVTITHAVAGYGTVTAGSVTVTVTDVNNAPVFETTVADQTYIQGMSITALTLPRATRGNTPVTHTLTGVPAGLTFNDADLTLTGMPTTVAPAVTLTYTATDDDDDMDSEDTATLIFSVTIALAPAVDVAPTALTVDEGGMNTYTVVLITRPDNPVIVTPAPDSRVTTSGGLTFAPATWNVEQTVTVSAELDDDTATETVTITHTVSGYGGVTAASVSVVVNDVNGVPAFEATATDQTYTERTPISTLTLPGAAGGDGALSYTLTGPIPDGLTFIPASRTLVGCPVVVTDVTLTYIVSDADTNVEGDEDVQTFTVTINAGNPTVTLSTSAITMAEGTETTYTMFLTTKPVDEAIITPTAGDGARLVTSGALTFTTTNWNMAQTVTVTSGVDRDADNDVVTITHAAVGYGATIDAIAVTVTDNDNAPDFGGTVVAPQSYTVDIPTFTPIALTLPEAAGGDGDRVYALSPALPAGLSYAAATRTLTVTTPVPLDLTLTWTVSDMDRNTDAADEDQLTFPLTVTIVPRVIVAPADITVVEGGESTYTVVLTTDPDNAVSVQLAVGDRARLTGPGAVAFSAANWNIPQTVTVTAGIDRDAADDTVSITHTVTGYGSAVANAVTVTITDNDSAPDFGTATVAPQVYTLDTPTFSPVSLVLPEADAGDGDVTYVLSPFPLPAGLSYIPTTRTLTVAAPLVQDLVLTWTVSDEDDNMDSEDEDVLIFSLVVNVVPRVIVAPTALTVAEGSEDIYTLVLTTNPGGPVTVTPTVSDRTRITGPGVVSFGAANWDVVQTVTVVSVIDDDAVEDAVTVEHAVAGYPEVTDVPAVSISIPDTNSAPTFGVATVSDQTYTLNTVIPTLTLPRAMAGDGVLNYTLTPVADIPAGLTLTAGVYTLSGTPTLVAPAVELTWAVVDVDNQRAFLTFTVLVKSDLDAAIARRNDLNRVILPEVARALADHGVGAISERIRQAGSDAGLRRLTVGGQSTLSGALTDHGRALIEGRLNLRDVLAGSDFVLPLNAREVVPGTGISDLSVWGSGDYRRLSGDGDAIDWEGGMFSAQLGADARLREDVLAGVAISWGNVDLDYNYVGEGTGDYGVDLTTVYPYIGWTALSGRADVWATAGYGWGELEITDDEDMGDDPATRPASSDITMKTLGAGGSARVLEGHGGVVRIKGEALQTVMDIDGSVGIASTEVEARRMRVSLEASHIHSIAGWGEFEPVIEVGMRHDAGDGRTGTGAEVGGRVRYTDISSGLTIESHGRVLVGHSGGYRDWGIGGSVRLDAGGGDGRGLSFSVRPVWGVTSSRVSQVWAQEAAATVASASGAGPRAGRVDLDVGYGLAWGGGGSGGGGEVVVTPYGAMSFTSGLARSYRVGGRMRLAGGVDLNLEGTRREGENRRVDHGVLLKIGLNF